MITVNNLHKSFGSLEVLKGVFQCRSRTFAMAMAMETLNACRKLFGQLLCKHSETAAFGTGVVQFCLYLTIFRIDS